MERQKADRRSTRYIGKSWNSLRPTGSLRFPSAFRRIHSYLNESAFRRSWKPSRNSSSTGATGVSSSRRWWPEASCRSGSEAVMVILVGMGLDPAWCLVAASAGNTLGGMTCYWIGTLRTHRMDHPAGRLDPPVGPGPEVSRRTRRPDGILRLSADHRRGAGHRAGADAQQRVAHRRLDARRKGPALRRHSGLFRRGRHPF